MSRLRKSVCFAVLAIFGCALIQASPASAAPPDLEVNGNRIEDASTGKVFVPRGVNWPSFEYACVQGWGYSNHGAGPETAQAMLDWKINTVRIPLNQDCWLGDDGQPASGMLPPYLTPDGYREAVADFVGYLNGAGLAVILDLHWSGQQGTVANGLRPMADQRSDDFWRSVASRFRPNRAVMFDLFNEPHSRWDPAAHDWAFQQSWTCWRSGGCLAPDQADVDLPLTGEQYETLGMAALLSAVRSTGATQPVILSGLDYANDLSQWVDRAPDDGQLIAGFHNYPGQRCRTTTCWRDEIENVAARRPVITAEIGQRDCSSDHITRYMNWADQRGIGYLAWAWWVLPEAGCSNYALIEDLDGTPTPGYGAALRSHLLDASTPPDDQPPPQEPRIKRTAAGLRVTKVRIRGRRLRAKLKLDPGAGRAVAVNVEFFRAGKLRRLRLKSRISDGRGLIKRRLPRNARPRRLIVRYPGDELLLPGKVRIKLKGGPRGRFTNRIR